RVGCIAIGVLRQLLVRPSFGIVVVHSRLLSASDGFDLGRAGADVLEMLSLPRRTSSEVRLRDDEIARFAMLTEDSVERLGLLGFERALRDALIERALERAAGNRSAAARSLAIPRPVVQRTAARLYDADDG
ncbi:MAG TPA: helix-turn-helix domain-containing protein, partial [Myxococcota bacterium]